MSHRPWLMHSITLLSVSSSITKIPNPHRTELPKIKFNDYTGKYDKQTQSLL